MIKCIESQRPNLGALLPALYLSSNVVISGGRWDLPNRQLPTRVSPHEKCNPDFFVNSRILGKERLRFALSTAAVSQNKALLRRKRKTTGGNAVLPPPGGKTHNNGVLFLASVAAQINVF